MLIGAVVAALRKIVGTEDMTPEERKEKLDALNARRPDKLSWETSVVDLLKLIDQPSGWEDRRELAEDLGYDGSMSDSAELNTWLHARVLEEIASHDMALPK